MHTRKIISASVKKEYSDYGMISYFNYPRYKKYAAKFNVSEILNTIFFVLKVRRRILYTLIYNIIRIFYLDKF